MGEEWYAPQIEYVPELKWIKENLSEGDIVADCGCHHGFVGVLCSKWVGASGRVIGFEGLPQNVEIIRKNIQLNNLENFEVRNEAIGRKKGTVKFTPQSNAVVSEGDDGNAIEIPMVSLDEVFRSEKPTFLKIDVEGYELEVLKGAQGVMRTLPKLDIEIHCLLFKDSVSAVRELMELLQLPQYRAFIQFEWNSDLVPYNPEKHTPEMISGYDKINLFARPRNS